MFWSTGTHRRRRAASGAIAIALAVVPALPAFAASSAPSASESPASSATPGPTAGGAGDQVVLLGRVVVPRGESVGEVVVFSGRVTVDGVVRGDVVVLDGQITVSGQVSGSVIALNGSVRLLATAQIGGDVLAHDVVIVAEGAAVGGLVNEHVSFNLSGPLRAVGALLSWLAVAVSTLVLGLLFALMAPRALDRTAAAAWTAPWASAGWGVLLGAAVPVLAVGMIASVVGVPLGVGLLLAIVLLTLVGAVVTAHAVGRALVGDARGTATAFLAGWGIATVIGLIPYVSGVVFGLSVLYGTGATAVAVWRARGPRRSERSGGKHRRR
jgi:cytoskeletal protein CcmA (bactofilin family)